MKQRPVALIVMLCVVPFLVGCWPRGETKTLGEVFEIAKERYDEAIVSAKANGETKEQLANVVKNVGGFLEASGNRQTQESAGEVSNGLSDLVVNAGYTTRPALNELAKTYRGIAAPAERAGLATVDTSGDVTEGWELDASAKRLLAARTYTALAQELETTAFQVTPKGAG